MFLAGWKNALMIHFEVNAGELQSVVPYPLDLWQGKAFVSLVAFTMCGMRPVFGGKLGALIFRPVAPQHFLRVRTYVRHRGEPGIHFLVEWLNSRLAASLGPLTFSLCYRHGHIEYPLTPASNSIAGRIVDSHTGNAWLHRAVLAPQSQLHPCFAGSRDEWLMERYIAFDSAGGCQRSFRIWHPPWPQCPAEAEIIENSLVAQHCPWFRHAKLAGANYSPGFDEVWMGRPHFCGGPNKPPQQFRHGAFFGEGV